jgi:hypothetical protein
MTSGPPALTVGSGRMSADRMRACAYRLSELPAKDGIINREQTAQNDQAHRPDRGRPPRGVTQSFSRWCVPVRAVVSAFLKRDEYVHCHPVKRLEASFFGHVEFVWLSWSARTDEALPVGSTGNIFNNRSVAIRSRSIHEVLYVAVGTLNEKTCCWHLRFAVLTP